MRNNAKNEIQERAMQFLEDLDKDELQELVFSNNMDSFPSNHITRKFVDYAYGDTAKTLGFTMCLIALYPYIAQEAFKRYKILLHEFCEVQGDC